MAADPVDPEVLAGLARNAPLTRPAPATPTSAGMQKYGFDEARPILERASARETAARVALGAVARSYLKGDGRHRDRLPRGRAGLREGALRRPPDPGRRRSSTRTRCAAWTRTPRRRWSRRSTRPTRTATRSAAWSRCWRTASRSASAPTYWDRRLDARLAAALMGIQAIKGVEVSDGFELARVPGSQAHDEIVTTPEGIKRASGRSGGTEGGLSTGELLRVRAAMKPIATVPRALQTVDVVTGEPAQAHHQRSDVCAVPAAGIVAEAMVALVPGGRRRGEVRRRLRAGDPPQRAVVPRQPGDQVSAVPAIVLVGPMGVGKSTVGRLLAERLGVGYRDTDDDIVAAEGRTIAEIFVDEGEAAFRALEKAAVRAALAEHPGVVALGGGAVLDADTRCAAGRAAGGLPVDGGRGGRQAHRPRTWPARSRR